MIPAALASQLTQCLADFLRFSFASTTPGLERVIEDFLATSGAVLKGPYVSLQLPFTTGTNPAFFPKLPLPFTPHGAPGARVDEEPLGRRGGEGSTEGLPHRRASENGPREPHDVR